MTEQLSLHLFLQAFQAPSPSEAPKETVNEHLGVWSGFIICASTEDSASSLPLAAYTRGLCMLSAHHACACACVLSCVLLFAALRTVAHQAPLSIEFSRQEYWSGLPFPTPGESSQPRD